MYLTSKNVIFKVLKEIDSLLLCLLNHNCRTLSSPLQDMSVSGHKETASCLFRSGNIFTISCSFQEHELQSSGPARPSPSIKFVFSHHKKTRSTYGTSQLPEKERSPQLVQKADVVGSDTQWGGLVLNRRSLKGLHNYTN